MTGLWRTLQADHDLIWELLDEITGGSGRPHNDDRVQQRLMRRLVTVQSAHEFAEEAVVWPLVRRHCPHGDQLADEALQQECMLKRQLNELYHLRPGTQEFDEGVNSVAAENRDHLSYEQNQAWPRLADALSDEELDRAARAWAAARRAAPTRPHPHLPASPAVLRAVAPVLAVRDRLADAVLRQRAVTPTP